MPINTLYNYWGVALKCNECNFIGIYVSDSNFFVTLLIFKRIFLRKTTKIF